MKFLKRFYLFAVLALLAIQPASAVLTPDYVSPHNHSSAAQGGSALVPSSVAVTGASSSTKACASGYTRITPNYCKILATGIILQLATNSTACVQSTSLSGVANAKGIHVFVTIRHVAGNSIAQRYASVTFYRPTDTACTGTYTAYGQAGYYEYVAKAVDAILGDSLMPFVLESDTSGRFYAKTLDIVGAGANNHIVSVLGYFD